ncbi:MAG: phosphoribosylformylglycinamidine synthase subunit PurL [Candidatus Thermoplasmatota archaeon]|nr:phosphoribosylformylglycinamidine synthase subunit PurL [Candidatus Thermoplasmatota archaeon]
MIRLRGLSDDELMDLSRGRQLNLSFEEMRRAQKFFLEQGREPTEVELEAIAQAWSEHCSYKSSKPVMRRTIFKCTKEGMISDDAGVVEFDEDHYYAAALESHNHPSALDPYGGAATGVGGIVRDVLCMGAKPVASANMLFFGPLSMPYERLPRGTKHPAYLLRGVVKGISDYGNRIGVPTISGLMCFDESYTGNCLVNVGCAGIMRKEHLVRSKAGGEGDIFVLAGGKTGRDGIHGVTFASYELSEGSEVFSRPAVQLGDPLTKEVLIHAVLECVEERLVTGMKDLGGGGLSSCVCEMSSELGAEIELDNVPLRERMEPWEIWVSESQERMMLTVREENLSRTLEIFEKWDIDAAPIGRVTSDRRIRIFSDGKKVADMPMDFLSGLECERPCRKREIRERETEFSEPESLNTALLNMISYADVASKEYAIKQYDQVIQGNAVLYPLQGRFNSKGPGDASIIKPLESMRGLAVTSDSSPLKVGLDPYRGSRCIVEESLRNLVAVGAKPESLLDCLNFGNPEDESVMGDFVSVCEGIADAAMAFDIPVISGNVSFYNESSMGAILPTPVLMGIGIIDDVRKAVSMDVKSDGNSLYLIGETDNELGGSQYARLLNLNGGMVPKVDGEGFMKKARSLLKAMDLAIIASCHDVSDGGIGVALAEMLFAGGFGAKVSIKSIPGKANRFDQKLFSESNGRWIVEVERGEEKSFKELCRDAVHIGQVTEDRHMKIDEKIDMSIDDLCDAWKKGIDV